MKHRHTKKQVIKKLLLGCSITVNSCGFEINKILNHKESFDRQVTLYKKHPSKLTPYETQVINEALCRILMARVLSGQMKKEEIPSNILDNFPFEVGW